MEKMDTGDDAPADAAAKPKDKSDADKTDADKPDADKADDEQVSGVWF